MSDKLDAQEVSLNGFIYGRLSLNNIHLCADFNFTSMTQFRLSITSNVNCEFDMENAFFVLQSCN